MINKPSFGGSLAAVFSFVFVALPMPSHSENVRQAQEDSAPVMSPVVITASGYEQNPIEAPASVSLITREQIEKNVYKDLTDALRSVAGVVITGGGSRQEISIRGMPSEYTAILVDGRKQSGRETQVSSGGGFEQDWLPPLNAIERIEVVRGPMSTLYGSSAIGGVINVITRKDLPEWSGSLRAETVVQEDSKSGDFSQGEIYLAGPMIDGLVGLAVSGLYQERTEDDILYANGGKTLENYRTSVYLTPSDDDVFTLDYTYHNQDRVNTEGRSRTRTAETNNNRKSMAIAHDGRYGTTSGASHLSSETVENEGRGLTVENVNAKTQWSHALSKHYLSLGAAFETQELDNGDFLFENSQWSVFAEDEWYLTDALTLTMGVRFDDNEQFDSHWSPRIYAVWKENASWAVKGGISTGYRAPSLTEMEEDWVQESCNGRCEVYGNASLEPEKSVNSELGLYYMDESISSNLTVFYNDFKDKIDTVNLDPNCTGRTCDSSYINIEDAISHGFEASFGMALSDRIQFYASYTFTDSEKKSGDDKGQPLTQIPEQLLSLSLDWAVRDDINSWVRISHRSEESDPITVDSRSVSAPEISFVDLGGNWSVSKNLKLLAGIYNLLDEKTTYDEFGYVEDARRYWLAAEFSF